MQNNPEPGYVKTSEPNEMSIFPIRLLVSDYTISQNVQIGFYKQAGIVPQWV
jgi:hypothetical protein